MSENHGSFIERLPALQVKPGQNNGASDKPKKDVAITIPLKGQDPCKAGGFIVGSVQQHCHSMVVPPRFRPKKHHYSARTVARECSDETPEIREGTANGSARTANRARTGGASGRRNTRAATDTRVGNTTSAYISTRMTSVSASIPQKPRLNEEQRYQSLKQDEHVKDFGEKMVVCLACGNELALERRKHYKFYLENWDKHKNVCKFIKAMKDAGDSQPEVNESMKKHKRENISRNIKTIKDAGGSQLKADESVKEQVKGEDAGVLPYLGNLPLASGIKGQRAEHTTPDEKRFDTGSRSARSMTSVSGGSSNADPAGPSQVRVRGEAPAHGPGGRITRQATRAAAASSKCESTMTSMEEGEHTHISAVHRHRFQPYPKEVAPRPRKSMQVRPELGSQERVV